MGFVEKFMGDSLKDKYEIIKKMGGYKEVNALLKKPMNIGLIRYLDYCGISYSKLSALLVEYRRDHDIAPEPI